MKRERAGDYGWGLLITGVITWDLLAPETLSNAGRRYMEHPAWRYLYIGAIGATALHLVDMWPDGYDPFKKTLERVPHGLPQYKAENL